MISQEDIDALSEGNAAMDRVEARMERGVPAQREIMPSEMRPFILAALAWRNIGVNLWTDKMQSEKDSMSLHG